MSDTTRQDDPVISEFLELISEVTRDFTPHRRFPEFRVPQQLTPLDPLCDHIGIDPANEVYDIGTPLMLLEWTSFPGSSTAWSLAVLPLSTGDTCLTPREFLVDLFISVFNESANAWDSLDEYLDGEDEEEDEEEEEEEEETDPVLWDRVVAKVDAHRPPVRSLSGALCSEAGIQEALERHQTTAQRHRERRKQVERYFDRVLCEERPGSR